MKNINLTYLKGGLIFFLHNPRELHIIITIVKLIFSIKNYKWVSIRFYFLVLNIHSNIVFIKNYSYIEDKKKACKSRYNSVTL